MVHPQLKKSTSALGQLLTEDINGKVPHQHKKGFGQSIVAGSDLTNAAHE